VRLHGPRLHLADVVHEQDLAASDLEGVWRLEQLDADTRRGLPEQTLPVPIVATEDAADRELRAKERRDRERRAEVASVE
jgi:hypothetical protein